MAIPAQAPIYSVFVRMEGGQESVGANRHSGKRKVSQGLGGDLSIRKMTAMRTLQISVESLRNKISF